MALENTGYKGYKILEQIYIENSDLTGMIMPNIAQISPQAIIPNTSTITFNLTDIAPDNLTDGVDGDVWYNLPSDVLYKKTGGLWTILYDRITNDYYVAPVYNLQSCPLPAGNNLFITNGALQSIAVNLDGIVDYSYPSIPPSGGLTETIADGTYTVTVNVGTNLGGTVICNGVYHYLPTGGTTVFTGVTSIPTGIFIEMT